MKSSKIIHICDKCGKEIEISKYEQDTIELCSSCGFDLISSYIKDGGSIEIKHGGEK